MVIRVRYKVPYNIECRVLGTNLQLKNSTVSLKAHLNRTKKKETNALPMKVGLRAYLTISCSSSLGNIYNHCAVDAHIEGCKKGGIGKDLFIQTVLFYKLVYPTNVLVRKVVDSL